MLMVPSLRPRIDKRSGKWIGEVIFGSIFICMQVDAASLFSRGNACVIFCLVLLYATL
jgi:hypothetical protein